MKLQQYKGNVKTPRVTSTRFAFGCIEAIVDFTRKKIFIHKRPWDIYTLL